MRLPCRAEFMGWVLLKFAMAIVLRIHSVKPSNIKDLQNNFGLNHEISSQYCSLIYQTLSLS